MKLTGISDEAGAPIGVQIRAHKELGWDTIESRFLQVGSGDSGSFHEIPEELFEEGMTALSEAGLSVAAVGSTIGNWQHSVLDDFQITLDEVGRCIDRMQRVESSFVRVMSYKIEQDENKVDLPEQHAEERFRRMREVTQRFLDAGITPVHENCMNYGGMSISHALELLENVPGLKWVWDTGNPVFNEDRDNPGHRQDPWAYYEAVKEHIAHVHVKDGVWNPAINDCDYKMPGEGDGEVERTLADLVCSGYDGYVSIEPHLAVVFHDEGKDTRDPEEIAAAQYQTYVDYGRNLQKLVNRITTS